MNSNCDIRKNQGSAKTIACVVRSTTFAALILSAALLVPQLTHANKNQPQLPLAIFSATTIYVDNQTTDAQLQNNAYIEISKWGRFQIVDNPLKAHLILQLSNGNHVRYITGDERISAYDAKPVSATSTSAEPQVPAGFTRLTLLQRNSSAAVWSDLRKTNNPQAARHLLDGLREVFDQHEKSR